MPNVEGVEPVHIFAGVKGINDSLLVQVRGQRQLHNHAVHIPPAAEVADHALELCLGCVLFQPVQARDDAHLHDALTDPSQIHQVATAAALQ